LRKRFIGGAAGITAVTLVAASLIAVPAGAKPVSPAGSQVTREPSVAHREDNLPNFQAEEQTELKKEAIAQIVAGKVTPQLVNGSEVVKVKGRWVELKKKADKVDPIFTILAQFGDAQKPSDSPVVPDGYGGTPGPQANEIAEPDRTKDNSTYWKPDFNRDHYLQMVNGPGESMADFYYKQSGGKYSVQGDVSDWVQLPYNTAAYGKNVEDEEGNDRSDLVYWPFIKDTANAWYAAELAKGKTATQIADYLKQFDIWDRYDFDGDGDFNEADGYIDHFQAIHSGEGEEAGAQADSIWSHRWKAYANVKTGPAYNQDGGTQIGDTGMWIGDYTTEPENGGLGVFVHEYGHDLGLPDLYDTSGGDNSTAFWTVMSGGSWMSHDANSIGTSPVYMGPWEKLVLGWLDYAVVTDGKTKTVSLGSAATPQGLPQAVLVPLPDQVVTTDYNTPHGGSYEWWSGEADDLDVTLTRDLDLTGATAATVSAWAEYDIEAGYDYLSAEVSTDGGLDWNPIGTPISSVSTGWEQISYNLDAFAGQNIRFRFRYTTDGGTTGDGAFLDDITLTTTGGAGWSDDVEAAESPWVSEGWKRINGSDTVVAPHFYLAEYRTYTGYDKSFKVGPYNFGFANTKPDWVEKFPYQDGLLVWYVNYRYGNNNTSPSQHPGGGLALPVDARPAPIYLDGNVRLGNRRQPFDATFGMQKTDAVTFHRNGVPTLVPSQPAIKTFDDTNPLAYWTPLNPGASVKVAGDGVQIKTLLELNGLIMVVQVKN
jgi:immune inhibitor A